jgi:hypothetical protein
MSVTEQVAWVLTAVASVVALAWMGAFAVLLFRKAPVQS